MPVGGRGPPSKNCPICGARIWGHEDKMRVSQAWGVYHVHVHTNHPEYERWNRRMSFNYLVTILLATALPAVVFQVASFDAARLLTLLLWASAFVAGVAILAIQRKGTRRFRDLWNEEHGTPIEPH